MDDIQELYYLFPEIKEHIKVEKKVGQGSFSFVYMGYFLHDHEEKLALKYIIPTSSPSRTKQEIECLLNIGGQDNVVGVYSVLRNKSHILVLMPYIHHVAFHESFLTWSLDDVREYMRSLLVAMNRVHQCGIIHRDIKPSNFLYDYRKKIYALVDFGLAQRYEKSDEFDIFNEKFTTNKSRLSNIQNENTPKHNMIDLKSASSSSSKNAAAGAAVSGATLSLKNLNAAAASQKSSRSFSPGNVISIQKQLSAKTLHANTNCFSEELNKSNAFSNSISFDCDLNKAANLDFNDVNSPRKLPVVNNFTKQQQQQQADSSKQVVSPTLTTNDTLSAIKSSALMATKAAATPPPAKTSNLGSIALANKSSTPNLQKYYSFQKPSFSFDNKCTCYNMPFVCEICTTRNQKWAPRAGTAGFRAPEVLFRSTHQTPAVDIWSVGIIFLSLLSGRYPFFKAVDDNMAIMQLISLFGVEIVRKAAYKYGESLVCSYEQKTPEIKDICQLLRKKAIARASARRESMDKSSRADELFYEFPDSAYDLLKQLLEMDCDKRVSAEEALKHPFFQAAVPAIHVDQTTKTPAAETETDAQQ